MVTSPHTSPIVLESDTDGVSYSLDQALLQLLEDGLGTSVAIIDGLTGEVLVSPPDHPLRDWSVYGELCCEVARRQKPEYLGEEDPFLVFAVPFVDEKERPLVAVGLFLSREIHSENDFRRAASLLDLRTEGFEEWTRRQSAWAPATLSTLGTLLMQLAEHRQQNSELKSEADNLSVHLASTFEEISLLHRLSQNLKLSKNEEELGEIALEWLQEVIPAEGIAMQYYTAGDQGKKSAAKIRTSPMFLTTGHCPLSNSEYSGLMKYMAVAKAPHPVVVNLAVTLRSDWPWSAVHQAIAAPLIQGDDLFGFIAVFNHKGGEEFGTGEANLLGSVAAILSIHCGNIELYRKQSELMTGIVRVLTSAIDAKDQYTCGHSDRVARIAVRLAEELGCDAHIQNTIYLAGLLHDIGKIGIEDQVLRKPGKLNAEEYEHIKQHVEVGHRILRDLNKLEDVLPVVLHHHESWDGGGYPNKLAKESIPLAARIVAVADAYDAMSSDRPYRKGMPQEKIDEILRTGAGQQWDPQVIDAFFRAHNDICSISEQSHEESSSISEYLHHRKH